MRLLIPVARQPVSFQKEFTIASVRAGYLESGAPLAIMKHGETLGHYIPAQKRSRKDNN